MGALCGEGGPVKNFPIERYFGPIHLYLSEDLVVEGRMQWGME
jgi:hypothetical protein